MELDGVVPITRKFLQKNYLFALEFREGFVFGRVIRRRLCQWKPYGVIAADGSAVDVAAESYQTELEFRDPRNPKNDILYLSTTTNSGYPWFMHGGIGIKPQFINAYIRFPEGKDIPGKFPNVDPIRPSSGDDLGCLNSFNSPYEEPTDWVELVIPPLVHAGCEYYNKDTRAHQPVLNLTFALYWVQMFTKERNGGIIRKMALREVPTTFLTVGFGDYPYEMGDTLTKDWKVTPMSLEEAAGGA